MARIIALDEMGDFENRKNGVRFVGGYTCEVNNREIELMKIEQFLKNCCLRFNDGYVRDKHLEYHIVYPNSFHGSGDVFFKMNPFYDEKKNTRKWMKLPPKLNDDYLEAKKEFHFFLQKEVSCYFNRNNYQIFAFIYPYIKDEYIEQIGETNLFDMNQGSNLYERMAILSLYNQVFYYVGEEAQEYDFEIATRTLNYRNASDENMYQVYINKAGQKKSSITNTSTFKTAFSIMLYEKQKNKKYQDARYFFHVASVNYNNERVRTTPFLYLADIACGCIRTCIQKKFMIGINTKVNRITSNGLLQIMRERGYQFRIYGMPEIYFRSMIEAVKNVQIAEYFANQYELNHMEEDYKILYINYWEKKLSEHFEKIFRDNDDYRQLFYNRMSLYYAEIEQYMGYRQVSYEKGMYIASQMRTCVERSGDFQEKGKYLFRLNDVILRGHSHRGAIDRIKECIIECEKYKNYVDAEEYVTHSLRVLNFYFNAMDYQQVLISGLSMVKLVLYMKKAYKMVQDMSQELSLEIIRSSNITVNVNYIVSGRLYSIIGQAYGFLKQYENAKHYFEMALKEFTNDTANYSITLSYYLHLMIAHKKQEAYERLAVKYFGGKMTLVEQLAYVAEKDDYALFVYIKAFRVFYAKDTKYYGILEELLGLIQHRKTDCHPWELIYKNLYESVLSLKTIEGLEKYEYLKNRAIDCIRYPDSTIIMIQMAFEAEQIADSDSGAYQKMAVDYFDKERIKSSRYFGEVIDNITFRKMMEIFKEKITYMYE